MLVVSHEVGRRFSDIGRIGLRKMGGIISRQICIVIRQIGTDQLTVHTLKVVICLSIGRHGEVKVTGIHPQRPDVIPHNLIGPQNIISCQHDLGLRSVPVHDLCPTDVLFGPSVVNDVRTVQLGVIGIQRGTCVFQIGGMISPISSQL